MSAARSMTMSGIEYRSTLPEGIPSPIFFAPPAGAPASSGLTSLDNESAAVETRGNSIQARNPGLVWTGTIACLPGYLPRCRRRLAIARSEGATEMSGIFESPVVRDLRDRLPRCLRTLDGHSCPLQTARPYPLRQRDFVVFEQFMQITERDSVRFSNLLTVEEAIGEMRLDEALYALPRNQAIWCRQALHPRSRKSRHQQVNQGLVHDGQTAGFQAVQLAV